MKCSKTAAILFAIIFSVTACSQAGIMVNELPGGEMLVFISPIMNLSCSGFDFDLVYDTSELVYNDDYMFFGTPCNSAMGTLVYNDPVNGVLSFTTSWLSEIRDIDFLQISFLATNPVSDGVSDFLFASVTILNSNGTFYYPTVPAQGDEFYDVVPEPATILLLSLGGLILRKRNRA